MTPEKLDELYALAKKATPGPYTFDNHSPDMPILGLYAADNKSLWHHSRTLNQATDNTAYIAASSPDVVTALIDRVRELEGEKDSLLDAKDALLAAMPTIIRGRNAWLIEKAHAALNKE